MKNKAFTIVEIILVIVIFGIIISIAKFYYKDNLFLKGVEQILNDIKYVRYLSLLQDNFKSKEFDNAKREWFKAKWQIYFIKSKSATNNELTYTIFLDKNGDGNANLGKTNQNIDREIAVNILNSKKLMNSGQSGVINKDDIKATKRFNIEKTYGITKVEFLGSCKGTTRIVFDDLLRIYGPLKNSNNLYDKNIFTKNEKCILKFTNIENKNMYIVIDSATGYAYIDDFKK